MAFDVNQYKNAKALSPVEKITTAVTSNMSGAGRDQYIPVAQHATNSMIGNGLGQSNLIGLSMRRSDGVATMNASHTRDLYGDTTMKATPEAIVKSRLSYTESLDFYISEINPKSKIMRKKMDNKNKTLVAM